MSSKKLTTSKLSKLTEAKITSMRVFGLIIYAIFMIAINSMVIYLMSELRDKSCNCVSDWRNDFVIFYSSLIIFFALVRPILCCTKWGENMISSYSMTALSIVISIAALVNIYALYTYTSDLEETKCACAIDKNRNLFGFIYYFIRISLFMLLASILVSLLLSFFL